MDEKLLSFYDLLPENEKQIVQIACLIFSSFDLGDLLKVLNQVDIKDEAGSKYTLSALKYEKDSFIRKKIFNSFSHNSFIINAELLEYALRQIENPELVKKWANSINIVFSFDKTMYWTQSKKMIRNLRIAFYSHDWDEFQDNLSRLYHFNPNGYDFLFKELLNQLFAPPVPFNILTLIPSGLRKVVVESYLYPLLLKGEQNLADYTFLSKHLGKEAEESIHEAMSKLFILSGDLAKAAKINAKSPVKLGALRVEAIIFYLGGKSSESLLVFNEALKEYRKVTNSRKKYFPDITGIYYLLALLKTGDKLHFAEIEAYIDSVSSDNFYFYAYRAILAILLFQRNNVKMAEQVFRSLVPANLIDKMLFFIARFWIMPHTINLNELMIFISHAEKNGFKAVALELHAVATEVDSSYQTLLTQYRNKMGIVPFLEGVKRTELWELALDSLELELNLNTGKKEGKTKDSQESRLAWFLDFTSIKGVGIEAKEQVKLKNGKWSVGKVVSLARLAEKNEPFYTEQDIQAKNCIQKSNWTLYEWNRTKALVALVNHPHLYLAQNPNVQMELVLEPLELYIQKSDDFYTFKFSVEFDDDGIYIKKETPTRYQLIEVNDHHVKISKALNIKALKIPVKGEQRLANLLGNLSQYVTIHSDLAGENENLPVLEADKRIYVHLMPQGEGFSLELYVKPFGDTPPYFTPAKGGENVIANVLNVRTMVKRDLASEQNAANMLIEACPSLQKHETGNQMFSFEDSEECLQCLWELEELKKDDKIVIEWPKGERLKIAHRANFNNLRLNIQKENDWFGVSGELTLNNGLVLTIQELLDLVGKKDTNFVELSDGQFLALTKSFQRKLRQLKDIAGSDGKKGLRIHPLAAGLMDDFTGEMQNLKVDKAWKAQLKKLQSIHDFQPVLPANFHAELRPYQQEGYDWLAKLAEWGVGACLADDMGLGKTVQALAIILKRASEGPTLVIAPVSVCRNWVNEARKFAPPLNPIIFRESVDRKATIENAKPYDLLIVTYGLMQQESEIFTSKRFKTIVLDEAQAIKNFATKRSKAAMELQGDFKILTTGTPIENHLGELWNLFNFINPGLLGTLSAFNTNFAIPIERDGIKDKKNNLKRLIKPFILRRKKDEVLDDLPEKTEIVLTVELSEEEKAFYEALRRNALDNIEKADGQVEDIRFRILAEIMRLRRACCNPRLVMKDSALESSKLKLFENVVTELIENGHKTLVFSQFVDHLSILRTFLEHKNISYQYLDGSTPEKKRQEAVDAFQRGEGEVFLISLRAGGTGLNLTAADYVIHMDPWWNPAVEDQASDRVHRIGQTRPVTVYRLVTEQTIEEKILQLHHTKRDLADSLLEGTDSSAKLSAQDLLNLLKER